MANDGNGEMTVLPIPTSEKADERDGIRRSNDRERALEREGKVSRHNRGYDEAADGLTPPSGARRP
jgi:hypothetical protein